MAGDEETTGSEEPQDFVQRFVLPYIYEPGLMPVLIVVMGHAVAFGTPAVLLAVRDHRPLGILALGMLLFGTGASIRYELRLRGRPGALSVILAITWLLIAATAWAADRFGVF